MASGTKNRNTLRLDLPRTAALESPPGIAALFAIRFDIRTGYVIAWKRSVSDVEVEGVVEYKSLPSGLHNVTEDLVYFIHEQYAGISAFINLPAEESERNAKMFAVGVLVPLSFGRLGKSWRHAPKLKELVQQYAQDTSNGQPLTEYWETYQIRESAASALPLDLPPESPISVRFGPNGERPDSSQRNRAFSDAMVLEPSRPALTPFHPASSLPDLIESFGPLIYPLYKAALLRKRILLMTEAPVHIPCNYVYDLSLLASLPNSILPLLPSHDLPTPRPRPLFNIGIHDIPYLSSFVRNKSNPNPEPDSTWIACSTDSVLTMKPELYDVLVTLPASHTKDAAEKIYPKLSAPVPSKPGTAPTEIELKATQRDASRYARLRKGLRHLSNDENSLLAERNNSNATDDDSDAASTWSASPVVEPLSWARLAYTSFIWWASAGEKREGLSEEEEEQQIEQDTRLLASVESLSHPHHHSNNLQPQETEQQPPEVALVAYFRRLTAQIFVILADVVARHDAAKQEEGPQHADNQAPPYRDDPDNDYDDDDATIAQQSTQDDNDDDRSPLLHQRGNTDDTRSSSRRDNTDVDPVTITMEDMTEMGLDIWSATDRVFAEELVRLWWGRQAYVDSARIRCCGISIL